MYTGWGTARTLSKKSKLIALLDTLFLVTTTGTPAEIRGTMTRTSESDHEIGWATVPPMVTKLSPCWPPKPEPSTLNVIPELPAGGFSLLMVGFCEFLVCAIRNEARQHKIRATTMTMA